MSKVIYLYRKTHNITGLKYIGITKKDPFVYKGSGKYWVAHLNQYGSDVSTEILHECSEENLEYWCLYYSDLYDIVESKEYANLKPESGYGGTGMKGKKHSEETKRKIGEANTGREFTPEVRRRMSESHIGKVPGNKGKTGLFHHSDEHKKHLSEIYSGDKNPFFGKEHSDEFKELQRKRQTTKVICPYCHKTGAERIMKRWHFEKCKDKNDS